MATAIEMLTEPELLEYSQNFRVQRAQYPGSRLFPDVKTQYLEAKYYQLADNGDLPVMATVHGMNTEAEIGSRPTLDKVTLKKLLIKRKIDLNEKEALYLNQGVADAAEILRFIYNDVDRMAESVVTRAEVMKQELMATGKITVNENNLNFSVDYKVPSEQTAFSFDWTSPDADVLGDMQKIFDLASEHGQVITGMEISKKQLSNILKNKSVQKSIYGTIGEGILVPNDRLKALFQQLFSFSEITVNDVKYGIQKKDSAIESKRFYPDNKVTFYAAPNGSVGAGLWGVPLEESKQSPWTEKSAQQFITVVKYDEPDPPVTWTKAVGLLVPVLPNRRSLFIATLAGGTSASSGADPLSETKAARSKSL